MSLRVHLLNTYLRLIEKPHLRRATPAKLRSAFEFNARIGFHAPRGTTYREVSLPGYSKGVLSVAGPGASGPESLLYFHGGAYVFGSPDTHKAMLARLSQIVGCPALLPSYGLAPEEPFPAAINDARAVWDRLIANGTDPGQVILGGDSAGGGLALALLGSLIADGAALPAGIFAFSPLTDMTFSGASIEQNAKIDPVLPTDRISELGRVYLDGTDPSGPLASPLFADFTGGPPARLMVSDTEVLYDDTRRLVARMRAAGVDVSTEERHALPHVWPLFRPHIAEADETLRNLGEWIRQVQARSAES